MRSDRYTDGFSARGKAHIEITRTSTIRAKIGARFTPFPCRFIQRVQCKPPFEDRRHAAAAGEDAKAAYRPIQALAADPARSVAYLRTRLHPVTPVDEKHVQQWIADLDSDQLAIREKAMSELQKLGAAPLHALRTALADKPALETRRRLEPLIEKLEREEWPASGERLRIWRALEVLERVSTAEAKEVLTILANGAPRARRTDDAKAALDRLTQQSAGKR